MSSSDDIRPSPPAEGPGWDALRDLLAARGEGAGTRILVIGADGGALAERVRAQAPRALVSALPPAARAEALRLSAEAAPWDVVVEAADAPAEARIADALALLPLVAPGGALLLADPGTEAGRAGFLGAARLLAELGAGGPAGPARGEREAWLAGQLREALDRRLGSVETRRGACLVRVAPGAEAPEGDPALDRLWSALRHGAGEPPPPAPPPGPEAELERLRRELRRREKDVAALEQHAADLARRLSQGSAAPAPQAGGVAAIPTVTLARLAAARLGTALLLRLRRRA